MASKDFSPIEEDHLFFMHSSTESQADSTAHLAELKRRFTSLRSLNWLDIGCSQGEFTQVLLEAWNWPSTQLRLNLLEPVAAHRSAAANTLQPFSSFVVEEVLELADLQDTTFDVILANHSCYYVKDPLTTINHIERLLRPEGLGLIAIAGENNFLIELWHIGFASLGQKIPYWIAEDFQSAIKQSSLVSNEKAVPYSMTFEDTPENRNRILRFLFGEYWPQMDQEDLRSRFAPHIHGSKFHLETHCQHFVLLNPNR